MRYLVFELGETSGSYKMKNEFKTFRESMRFCRDIVQEYRTETKEQIGENRYIHIYGGDTSGKFRSLWICRP